MRPDCLNKRCHGSRVYMGFYRTTVKRGIIVKPVSRSQVPKREAVAKNYNIAHTPCHYINKCPVQSFQLGNISIGVCPEIVSIIRVKLGQDFRYSLHQQNGVPGGCPDMFIKIGGVVVIMAVMMSMGSLMMMAMSIVPVCMVVASFMMVAVGIMPMRVAVMMIMGSLMMMAVGIMPVRVAVMIVAMMVIMGSFMMMMAVGIVPVRMAVMMSMSSFMMMVAVGIVPVCMAVMMIMGSLMMMMAMGIVPVRVAVMIVASKNMPQPMVVNYPYAFNKPNQRHCLWDMPSTRRIKNRSQYGSHPKLRTAIHIDNQIGIAQSDNVPWGWFKRMEFRPWWKKHTKLHSVSGNVADKIKLGKNGSNHPQRTRFPIGRSLPPAALPADS